MRTELTDKSLCNDTDDRIRNQITGNSHISHTVQRTDCIVGMHGRNDQVTGDGSLYCNRSSLLISNLTDHNDIRVLTQNRTKCRCKSQVNFVVYLNLVDALKICLDRIFNRYDIDRFFI